MIEQKIKKKELGGIFDVIIKSIPISLNIIIANLPFTITMIYFKMLDKPIIQEILGLSTTFFSFFFWLFSFYARCYRNKLF